MRRKPIKREKIDRWLRDLPADDAAHRANAEWQELYYLWAMKRRFRGAVLEAVRWTWHTLKVAFVGVSFYFLADLLYRLSKALDIYLSTHS